jgi:hypothetical protein
MSELALTAATPDALLTQLIDEYAPRMVSVHRQAVAPLRGADDGSTLAALRRAQAPRAADRMAEILGLANPD